MQHCRTAYGGHEAGLCGGGGGAVGGLGSGGGGAVGVPDGGIVILKTWGGRRVRSEGVRGES
jgi:hypothetical protein